MKVEIKVNDKGICEYFKIDEKEYGKGIYGLDIKIRPAEKPEILITSKCDEFILDSKDNKLYLEKYQEDKELTVEDIIEYAKNYKEENR